MSTSVAPPPIGSLLSAGLTELVPRPPAPIELHDVSVVDDELEAGRHTARLDAAGLPSGTYLVRLTAGSFVQTERVTLVR